MVRRDFLESTGATYPEDMATSEDLTFYLTLLFWPDDPHPVRVAQPTYYYRLADSSRTGGGPEARALMASRVAEATGSDEFAELVRRWGPTHAWLSARADAAFEAQGRLRPRPEVLADVPPPAQSAAGGATALVGIKALQWMGRAADRDLRPAIAADIERQLARSV
jgi:hypothetical protein